MQNRVLLATVHAEDMIVLVSSVRFLAVVVMQRDLAI